MVVAAAALGVAAWLFGAGSSPGARLPPQIVPLLESHQGVIVLGPPTLAKAVHRHTRVRLPEEHPRIQRALRLREGASLVQALSKAGADLLLVAATPGTSEGSDVASQLMRGAYVEPLQAEMLTASLTLYMARPATAWQPSWRSAVAHVARRILEGARPPRLDSFPTALRTRKTPVEVMVSLRDATTRRLWRSARGTSFARALTLAAQTARKRWIERRSTMGSDLSGALGVLNVEVSQVIRDGTLLDRDPEFLDRAVTSVHGIGYEHRGAWRYFLPERTAAFNSPSEAFFRLFEENGLDPGNLAEPEFTLYRFVVEDIATSEANSNVRRAGETKPL